MSNLERDLIAKVAELAEIEEDEVETDVALRDLGVDSLMVLELVAFIEKRVGTEIPESEIAKVRTLRDILARCDAAGTGGATGGGSEPGAADGDRGAGGD